MRVIGIRVRELKRSTLGKVNYFSLFNQGERVEVRTNETE